jgi:hypothetical protein
MSYKRNASSNRDALFGGTSSGSGMSSNNKPAVSKSTSSTSTSTSTGYNNNNSSRNTTIGRGGATTTVKISDSVRESKLKEAKDYQTKANNCMEIGFFKKADPISACTFYKRSADAYKVIGDFTNEMYMRLSCATVNMQCTAYASAATDYTRAAELQLSFLQQELDTTNDEQDNEKLNKIRTDASTYYKKAADAWKQMNEHGKSATSMVSAAIALNSTSSSSTGTGKRILSKDALTGIEVAIESFVPDPLNVYYRYRQTGISSFIDEESDETIDNCSIETKELAKQHLVTSAYSHESIQQLINLLIEYNEYASALYACGAVSCLLEADTISTLTLSRAYVTETIVSLALGDCILAEEQFLKRHVQKTFYLSSRECQLAEELFRAIKNRDIDALNIARDIKTGPNRSALANLSNASIRQLVQELRISGIARSTTTTSTTAVPQPVVSTGTGLVVVVENEKTTTTTSLNDLLQMKTGYEQDIIDNNLDTNELANELDNLDFDGIDDSDDDSDSNNKNAVLGCGDDELDALEDDDLDLR